MKCKRSWAPSPTINHFSTKADCLEVKYRCGYVRNIAHPSLSCQVNCIHCVCGARLQLSSNQNQPFALKVILDKQKQYALFHSLTRAIGDCAVVSFSVRSWTPRFNRASSIWCNLCCYITIIRATLVTNPSRPNCYQQIKMANCIGWIEQILPKQSLVKQGSSLVPDPIHVPT